MANQRTTLDACVAGSYQAEIDVAEAENTRLRGLLEECVSFMDGAIEEGYANSDFLDLIDRINEGETDE
jgi:hypothetical protein